MKLTKAQAREWSNLTSGNSAKLFILERAGLVSSFTEIGLSGTTLSKSESVRLTPRGRALLGDTLPTPSTKE